MDTFSNVLLFCIGFGVVMERTRLARQASWDSCAQLIGVPSPNEHARRGIVLIAGLALAGSASLRFLA